MPAARVIHGEALAELAHLEAHSADAAITDPPYSSGGQFRGDRTQSTRTKYVQTDSTSGNQLAAFNGDSRDQRAYLTWCALWLAELQRVVQPGGICALFTDWRQLPTTTDALQAGGWVWRGIVPWHKPNGRRTQGRYANNCEYVVWGTNGPRPLDALPTSLGGFFQANAPRGRDREHITQKPVEVLRELVRIVPAGGTVLDPFAGTGTTGVAAVLEGREFVGVEQNGHFHRIAAERVETARGPGEQTTLAG